MTDSGESKDRRTSWACRVFGHRFRPLLTDSFWTALSMRCTRCGAGPDSGRLAQP